MTALAGRIEVEPLEAVITYPSAPQRIVEINHDHFAAWVDDARNHVREPAEQSRRPIRMERNLCRVVKAVIKPRLRAAGADQGVKINERHPSRGQRRAQPVTDLAPP